MENSDRSVRLKGLTVRFGSTTALLNVDLMLEPGQIVGLTGPSGAGKTTLCRSICGIQAPTEGRVVIHGKDVRAIEPSARDVAFMFESFALYPHLSVRENIAFPLMAPRRRSMYSSSAVDALVGEYATLTEIAHLLGRRPSDLSGGQRQRVALCRALIQPANAFLLDEPLSHLDAKLRHKLRGQLRHRLREKSVPSLWVSPDAMEAMSIADKLVVLVDGHVAQIGNPQEVYYSPANVDVARLVGDPPMSVLTGVSSRRGQWVWLKTGNHDIPICPIDNIPPGSFAYEHRIAMGIRPSEPLILDDVARGNSQSGIPDTLLTIYTCERFSTYQLVTFRISDCDLRIRMPLTAHSYVADERVRIDMSKVTPMLFDADTGVALTGTRYDNGLTSTSAAKRAPF